MDTQPEMHTEAGERHSASLFTLFRRLTGDSKTLIRQEVQLAKTEISEKISMLGRNATSLAIGGFVAYAGLIVVLIGLGWLVSWAFTQAGLSPFLSAAIGLGIIGVLALIVGVIMLTKGIKAFSKNSVKPQRTLETLHELKTGRTEVVETESGEAHTHREKPSSQELQAQVHATEAKLGANLDEVGRRLSPKHIKAQVTTKIQARPYRAGAIAMAAGFLSALLLKRRFKRSHAPA